MRRRLTDLALGMLLLTGAGLVAGCEHAEDYRWSEDSKPDFTTALTPPVGSKFGSWDKPSVSVYSFATQPPAASDASLRDLSDRGQAALITAMTATGAKPEDIRDLLAKPLKAKAAVLETPLTIEGSYKRTIVANVTKGWSARPGERLVWTWIHVRPLNFVFDGYSVIATDNQILNIEQVTNATTAGVNSTLGKTGSETSTTNTAGSPVSSVLSNVLGNSASVTGSLSNTYTTTAAINQQYLKLGADILPSELRIYRESERNLDVAGNTLIALTMRVDPALWHALEQDKTQRVGKLDLAKDDGAFQTPADVTFEVSINKAPPRCPLLAEVTLYYQARKVKDGRSYVEGKHDATYETGSYKLSDAVVVPADEVRKPSWRIYTTASPGQALQVRDVFGYDLPIDFTSFEQARNFAEWLDRNGASYYGKTTPAIGKSGLVLTSGVLGQPVFPGPYFAQRLADPADLGKRCAAMNSVVTPPAQQQRSTGLQ